MKPSPTHLPLALGRSRQGHRGLPAQVTGNSSRERRRLQREEKVTGTPTWMRKLEDRYQRLHKKIAALPTYQSPSSRFNLLTRKFLNEALARKTAVTEHSGTQDHSEFTKDGDRTSQDQDKVNNNTRNKDNTDTDAFALNHVHINGRNLNNKHVGKCTTTSTHEDHSSKRNRRRTSLEELYHNHDLQSQELILPKEGLYVVPELVEQASNNGDVCRSREASPPATGRTEIHRQTQNEEKRRKSQERNTKGPSRKLKGEQSGESSVSALQGSTPCRCNCHHHSAVAGTRHSFPPPPALTTRPATHPSLLLPLPSVSTNPATRPPVFGDPHTASQPPTTTTRPLAVPARQTGGTYGHTTLLDHSGRLSERDGETEREREVVGGSPDLSSAPPLQQQSTTDRPHGLSPAAAHGYDTAGCSSVPLPYSETRGQGWTIVCGVCGAYNNNNSHGPNGATTVAAFTAGEHARGEIEGDDGVGFGGEDWEEESRGGAGDFQEMGDTISPVLQTRNPISSAEKKRGSTGHQTTHNHQNHNHHHNHYSNHHHHHHQHGHSTSRTAPAAVEWSTDRPAPVSKRHRSEDDQGQGQSQRDPGDKSGDRTNVQLLPQMSMEARQTLRDMGTVGGGGEKSQEVSDEGSEDVEEEDKEEEDNHMANSITSLPSLTEPLPSIPLQRRSWHPNDTSTTHHPHYPHHFHHHHHYQQQQQQQQQSRENSLTASQKTTITRQKSYRSGRQGGDTTSSVNTTGQGSRSPRRSNKRPPSLHTSVNARVDPKSVRTLDTDTEGPQGGTDHGGKIDLDLRSVPSVGHEKSNRSSPEIRQDPVQRMHLPAITSRTEPNLKSSPRRDNVRHVNYRIRGVGSYRVARENTFEITAPDFDIRYRDVITCQQGDRETPPPEILEKSVGKVRDWLNKYYSYSPS